MTCPGAWAPWDLWVLWLLWAMVTAKALARAGETRQAEQFAALSTRPWRKLGC